MMCSMEEIYVKKEPKDEFYYKSSFVVKQESLLELNEIKNELTRTTYLEEIDNTIKAETDENICVKEIFPTRTIKTKISDEQYNITRCKQSIKKKTWLKRIIETFNHLFTSNRNTVGFLSSTDQNVSSPQNGCILCYICVKPFLSIHQLLNHFIRRHLVLKVAPFKIKFQYNHLTSNLKKNPSCSDANSILPKISIKPKAYSNKITQNNNTHLSSFENTIESQKCIFCLKSFKRKAFLIRHMKLHEGINFFKCLICLKKFEQKFCLYTKGDNLIHFFAERIVSAFKNMEEVQIKEEPKDLYNYESISIKEEYLDLKYEDMNEIKIELDRNDYSEEKDDTIKVETGKNSCVKQELSPKSNIKTETFQQYDIQTKTYDSSYRTRCIQSIKKKRWLKEMFQKFNPHLFTSNQNIVDFSFNRNQKVSSSRNVCVLCYLCVKPFLRVHQLWNHFVRCHLVLKLKVYSNRYIQNKNSNLTSCRNSNKSQRCIFCVKSFRTNSLFTKHMKLHEGTHFFKCLICSKGFEQSSQLISHMTVHTVVKPFHWEIYSKKFECEVCSKVFKQKTYLNAHMALHTETKLNRCKICLKEFKRKFNLKTHMNIHSGIKAYKCEICLKEFKQKTNLYSHMKLHTGIKPFKCEICLKEFRRKYHLIEHMNIHKHVRPFKCETCSKEFRRKSELLTHMNISFKCEVCSKEFKLKTNLNSHMKSHTVIKTFKCEICPKEYRWKHDLKTHMNIHTGVKSLKCEICSKEFKQKAYLYTHMKFHAGIKPFKCEICSKEFRRKYYLSGHMSVHTDIKPFKCEICSKEFKRKFDLKTHMNIHTGIKPFKCEICSKEFRRKYNLNTHMKIHTGKNINGNSVNKTR